MSSTGEAVKTDEKPDKPELKVDTTKQSDKMKKSSSSSKLPGANSALDVKKLGDIPMENAPKTGVKKVRSKALLLDP